MSVPALGPFFSDDIAGFLAEYGYTANPAGLVGQYSGDFTFERDSWAWLDVNAIAVRQGVTSFQTVRFGSAFAWNTTARLHSGSFCLSRNCPLA
jgi:hypothetical protein